MGGQIISRQEKLLVLECRDKDTFTKRYIEKFGVPSRLFRIDNVWSKRQIFREELGKPNIEHVSKVTTGLTIRPAETFPDVGETLAKISNKISELIQLQKEELELFRKLDKTPPEVKKDAGIQESGAGHG